MGSRGPVLAAAAAAATLLLTACGDPGGTVDDRGDDRSDAGSAPSARPSATPSPEVTYAQPECPEQLAEASGLVDPATATPSVPELREAVVCSYFSGDDPDGGWERQVGPVDVPATDLTGLDDALAALRPAPADQMCTMDLGRRLLLVGTTDDGPVAVVAEDYGCRNVLMTDDPASTAPGSADAGLAVPGALADGGELVQALTALVDAPAS